MTIPGSLYYVQYKEDIRGLCENDDHFILKSILRWSSDI